MAERPGRDTFAVWRDLLGQWEKGMNSLANETMASDQYTRSINGMMNLSLDLQRTLGESMAAYLTALNLPSKSDLSAISERLASIETRLDRIVTAAEGLALGAPARPEPVGTMPPRTRKPKTVKSP